MFQAIDLSHVSSVSVNLPEIQPSPYDFRPYGPPKVSSTSFDISVYTSLGP